MAGKGSPKGVKQGGRKKGTPNKKNQVVIEAVLKNGITPLEVMLMAMNDALERKDMKEASNFAKDAAPYVHAKLQATTISGDAKNPLEVKQSLAVDKLSDSALTEILNAHRNNS